MILRGPDFTSWPTPPSGPSERRHSAVRRGAPVVSPDRAPHLPVRHRSRFTAIATQEIGQRITGQECCAPPPGGIPNGAKEVIQILGPALTEATPLSVLELQGLGEEVWAGVNVDEYLRRERQAWD